MSDRTVLGWWATSCGFCGNRAGTLRFAHFVAYSVSDIVSPQRQHADDVGTTRASVSSPSRVIVCDVCQSVVAYRAPVVARHSLADAPTCAFIVNLDIACFVAFPGSFMRRRWRCVINAPCRALFTSAWEWPLGRCWALRPPMSAHACRCARRGAELRLASTTAFPDRPCHSWLHYTPMKSLGLLAWTLARANSICRAPLGR